MKALANLCHSAVASFCHKSAITFTVTLRRRYMLTIFFASFFSLLSVIFVFHFNSHFFIRGKTAHKLLTIEAGSLQLASNVLSASQFFDSRVFNNDLHISFKLRSSSSTWGYSQFSHSIRQRSYSRLLCR